MPGASVLSPSGNCWLSLPLWGRDRVGASGLRVGVASIDASRCSVVVGRSSRAPASGAIVAMSDADGAANLETRAGDSVTSGNLETETRGVDASAMAELRVCSLLLSDGVAKPP